MPLLPLVEHDSPTPDIVSKYIGFHIENAEYSTEKQAVDMLVTAFPRNDHLESVLIKVNCLNSIYQTQIKNINLHHVSAEIARCRNLDTLIASGSSEAVNLISKMNRNSIIYSFATKYCHVHNRLIYPIFDKWAARTISHYLARPREKTSFTEALRSYQFYIAQISAFRQRFHLEEFSVEDLDRYLWRRGQEV